MSDTVFDTRYGKITVSPETDRRSFDRLQKGIYIQADDIELVRHFITPTTTVVDVGAHVGSMTVPFAQVAKQVYACEPMPTTRAYLEKNIALNNLTNVTVLPFALGREDAEHFISITSAVDAGQNTVSETGEVPVSVRTLDELIKEAGLLKIDAEGLEYEVLLGAQRLLATKPVIFCEINYGQLWAHHSSPRQVAQLLQHMGYTLYTPLGTNRLGRVWSIALITALMHPAYALGLSRNHAFDILATTAPLPTNIETVLAPRTILELAHKKLLSRVRRLFFKH